MKERKTSRFMPLLMALCVIVGVIIGTFYANHFSGNRLNIINTNSNIINTNSNIINTNSSENRISNASSNSMKSGPRISG